MKAASILPDSRLNGCVSAAAIAGIPAASPNLLDLGPDFRAGTLIAIGVASAPVPASREGNDLASPTSHSRLRVYVAATLFLLGVAPRLASADVCVTIDATRDMFSDQDRVGALNLLTRQFEMEGERVVPPGCDQAYVVYHILFGMRISITLLRTERAAGCHSSGHGRCARDLQPNGALVAQGRADGDHREIINRGNMSGTQSESQKRVHSDLVYCARLGYSTQFGDQAYGGPSVGMLGFRREGDRFGIDISFFNLQFKSSNRTYYYGYPTQGTSGQTGTWLRMQVMRYFKPAADRSPYVAGGLSYGAQVNLDHDNMSFEGDGLQGD